MTQQLGAAVIQPIVNLAALRLALADAEAEAAKLQFGDGSVEHDLAKIALERMAASTADALGVAIDLPSMVALGRRINRLQIIENYRPRKSDRI